MLASIAYLIFMSHTAIATEKSDLQQQPHITVSRIKATLLSFGKEAGRIVISNARQQPDAALICGIVLAGAGAIILLKTIMSDLPKIIGSTVMIGVGAALVFFANRKGHQSKQSL